MALDYKKSYKNRIARRNLIICASILGVFLIASAVILFLQYRSGFLKNGFGSKVFGTEKASQGKSIERQPIHLYSIGVQHTVLGGGERLEKQDKVVEDAYFDDALFIGDSRTEGLMLYSSLSNMNVYCSKGLSVDTIYKDQIVDMDGQKIMVMEALQKQQYSKIYIMFGVNELGWEFDYLFEDQYTKLIMDIRQLQPDAIIYVQNILPISQARSDKDAIYNNTNVNHFNTMIENMCTKLNVVYLDVASSMKDETGALPADASTDGVHCNKDYCEIWLNYLKANTYK